MALRYVNVGKLRTGDTFTVDQGLLSGCIVSRVKPVSALRVQVWVMVPGEGEYSVELSREVDVWVHR